MAKGKMLETIVNIAGEISPTLGKSFDGLAKKLDSVNTKALAVGAAIGGIAIGTGVAVFKAVDYLAELGDEYNSAVNDISAATGLVGKELEGMGDVIKDVYGSGMGESMEDAAAGISSIYQATNLTGDALSETTKAAYLLSDTFGYDVAESARAAKAMMTNFGITGEEAMNMIANGAQNGLDYSGELIDSINEYSVQFAKLGFSADDMFKIFQEGADNGAWNLDKVGDAIKEFSIRSIDGSKTTTHAFEALGLNADEMMATFAAGGDGASIAFQGVAAALMSVEDEVQRDLLGVELFGTQWEDLGVEALAAMSDVRAGAYDTTDALGQIASVKYDNIGDAFEVIKRQAEVALLPLASTVANVFTEIAPFIGDLFTELGPLIEELTVAIMPFLDQFLEGIKEVLPKLVPMISQLGQTLLPIFSEFVGELLPPLLSIIQNLLPALMNIVQQVLPALAKIILKILPFFVQIVDAILPVILELIEELLPVVMQIVDMLLPVLLDLIDQLVPIIVQIIEQILPIVLDLIRQLTPIIVQIIQAVLPILVEILMALTPIIVQIIEAILPVVLELLSALMPILEPILTLIATLVDAFLPAIVSILETLVPIIEVVSSILAVVLDIIEPIIKAIGKVVGWLASGLEWVVKLFFGGGGDSSTAEAVNAYATGGFTNGLSIAGEDPRYPQEAIISFNPAYRAQNLSYWARAGRMLGADVSDYHLSGGGGGGTTIDFGGVTFAPRIVVNGNADKETIMQAIEDEYPEFCDMLERFLAERMVPVYG